ncbi:hypothetical protein GTY40_05565 [Streptomyces sp. SID8359]|uniref:hypothetical protein n=1 Tax=unclassified Streptomyces TaxID=2593676 RepID=UPI000A8A3A62|nr:MULTISPECIES: hypothetical protein [unclassified Streptomyces]MYT90515.1 hypothetical protein [Streptomyces sp. SID8359]
MHFRVGEAQAYPLTEGGGSGTGRDDVFDRVGTEEPEPATFTSARPATRPTTCTTA